MYCVGKYSEVIIEFSNHLSHKELERFNHILTQISRDSYMKTNMKPADHLTRGLIVVK